MNRTEAFKKDREFYSEYDNEHNSFCVFGSETGFCYMLSTEGDCEQEAERLNKRKEAIKTELSR